jgi:hypothetical protein
MESISLSYKNLLFISNIYKQQYNVYIILLSINSKLEFVSYSSSELIFGSCCVYNLTTGIIYYARHVTYNS